jgi:hypothetical protein
MGVDVKGFGQAFTFRLDGYVIVRRRGQRWLEHRWLATLALGRALPPGVEVHHLDLCRWNNEPSNLVVCPDAAYHRLLHERTKALGYEFEDQGATQRAA